VITGEPDAWKAGTSGSEGGRAGKGPARQAPRRAAHPTHRGPDPFHLKAVFGANTYTALRYADVARQLLQDPC
jgi:hypothetical protein